jgi:beta-phosphoglucomutase-like phosphatase (HAD superfamily)
VIIFDCNGVLVDSEQIAAEVAADELARAGIAVAPELMIRYLSGRRPTDMFAMIETVSQRKLPANFGTTVATATVKRLRADLRAIPHAAYALTWLRGPKCVASSSPPERIRASLETAGLARFFKFVFPQAMCRTASLRPIYSCTQQRGWACSLSTVSWSRTLRLV